MIPDEKIQQIFSDIQELRSHVGRLESDARSEKDTRAARNTAIDKLILKVESDVKDVLYGTDRRSGVVVEVDRLIQIKKLVWGLIILMLPIAVTVIFGWFRK